MNYYQILEIDVDANLDEIIKQYRRLALLYHPDKTNGDSKMFLLIQESYEELKDKKRRKKYDKENFLNAVQPTSRKGKMKGKPAAKKSTSSSGNNSSKPKSGPRYSDEDLKDFEQNIKNRLIMAKEDLSYLEGLVTNVRKDWDSDKNEKYNLEFEEVIKMAGRQSIFVTHLESALVRIENKSYGICALTGELIERDRLLEVPHATLTLKAKLRAQ